jgi:hypothetical protein
MRDISLLGESGLMRTPGRFPTKGNILTRVQCGALTIEVMDVLWHTRDKLQIAAGENE